jgi:hypothetical protein
MTRTLIIIIASLILVGCVNDFAANEEAKMNRQKYIQSLTNDKTLDPIRDKIYFGALSETPFSYFVNKSFVKDSERKALENFQSINAVFTSEGRNHFQKNSPHLYELYNYLTVARFTIFTDLYNGKISYGEYAVKNKEVLANYDKAREQRQLEIQRYNAQIVSEAVNSFVTQLNNQQLINTLNNSPARIAPFTCQNYGRTINCW